MSRPRKCKKVCLMPKCTIFLSDNAEARGEIIMTIDEYETIRLIDYENLTQEQCAAQMQVARTTVQALYAIARKKIAEYLMSGKKLNIQGGDYKLCENREKRCKNCCKKKNMLEHSEKKKCE